MSLQLIHLLPFNWIKQVRLVLQVDEQWLSTYAAIDFTVRRSPKSVRDIIYLSVDRFIGYIDWAAIYKDIFSDNPEIQKNGRVAGEISERD
jgi:hypothetical protein